MSGILSILNRDGSPLNPRTVDIMLDVAVDREVDGRNVWIDRHVALGHQHFWITPQEWGEQQPLVAESGRLVVTADIRLDNRVELFKLLDLDTAVADKLSDAALLLLAYKRWGTGCVEKFVGDFAFVIWDGDQNQLFCARDAMGTRGLCYYVDQQRCLVASEIAQLLAHPAVVATINENKIADYLVGLYQDQQETYFQDIYYCPPAHCLLISDREMRKWRFWDIDPSRRIRYKDEQEYADHFLELFTDAVRCRLRTVGPVGISMSGGLDSTTLAAVTCGLMAGSGLSQKQLASFSYVFDELKSCDERQYIQPVVERYPIEPTFIPCDDKWTLRNIDKWPVMTGVVFHDPFAWLPDSVRAAVQQKGCRVLLAGYFGDVLFIGARSWAAGMMGDLRLWDLAETIIKNATDFDWRRNLVTNGLRHMVPHVLRMRLNRRRSYDFLRQDPSLSTKIADLAAGNIRRDAAAAALRRRHYRTDYWHRYMSMSHNIFAQGFSAVSYQYHRRGMELVMPYWDRRLFEFVMAVPADQLGRPPFERWLLRNVARRLLPEKVANRRQKTSFIPLMKKGVLDKEVATIAGIFTNPLVVERGYVREKWLADQLEDGKGWHIGGHRDLLWKYLSLELWLKFLDTSRPTSVSLDNIAMSVRDRV